MTQTEVAQGVPIDSRKTYQRGGVVITAKAYKGLPMEGVIAT
jgi:hypothetical protein